MYVACQPYFGLGANSALEDVAILSDCIDEAGGSDGNTADAIREFSRRRAKESETLVRISRDLDRPGLIGAFTFIIPIILDSIFHGINPKLFAPNVISMLQRDDLTFNQIARRKRLDRTVQVAVLGCLVTGAAWTAKFAVATIGKAVRRRASTVAVALTGIAAGLLFSKKAFLVLNPNNAPADVLAKMKSPITDEKETLQKEEKS